MLADPRAHVKVREFFLHWLRLEHAPQINKDPKVFPGFDRTIIADLRKSLELFIDEVVWGNSPDFRRLLTEDRLFMNGRLAAFYGSERPPEGTEFKQVRLEPEEHAGLISHPYILATFSYRTTSSPIHRGVFLARGILGRLLKPPPVAVAPLPADLHAGLTTRERVAIQTSPTSCNTCHSVINPLGFALEKFDAIGRVRSFENQKPIDASGSYQTLQGETVRFTGAKELAEFLCTSDEVRTAFVEQLFHHLNKQPIRAYGPDMATKLKLDWIENGYNVRRLIVNTLAWSSLAESANGSKGRP